jgi:hypothetical protein
MNLKTLIEQLELIKQQAERSKGPQYAKSEQLRVLFEQQPVVGVIRQGNTVRLLKNDKVHTN